MSIFPRRRKIQVKPVTLFDNRVFIRLYEARYMGFRAYGFSRESAIERVQQRYDDNRFSLRNVGHAIGYAILWPFL